MPLSPIKHRAARSWHKLRIQVDARLTEPVAAYLADLTGTGLEIASTESDRTKPANIFPGETITAYIPIGPTASDRKTAEKKLGDLRRFLADICQFFPDYPVPELQAEILHEEDWGKKWKSFFTSFQITESLIIRPSWEAHGDTGKNEAANRVVIEMDPGLAFGTGHHASTQLALLLLEELFLQKRVKPATVLDVGTGSGILAMACVLFGADKALALDNDPDAVETAKDNIHKNSLTAKITVSGDDVTSLKAGFDVVVANITHDTLAGLAADLTRRLNPHGFLVLSGILKGAQARAIRDIYQDHGLNCLKSLEKDEWAALQFQKK